jgi:hypothetical protein
MDSEHLTYLLLPFGLEETPTVGNSLPIVGQIVYQLREVMLKL